MLSTYNNELMTERTLWTRRTKPLPEPHLARLQKRMAKGQTLEEAAEGVGLTLSLAKSVFIRSGLPVPKPLRRRPIKSAQERKELGEKIHLYLRHAGSASVSEVAQAFGVTTTLVRAALWDQDQHRLTKRPTMRERYSDTGILIGLQLMASERGRTTYARGPVPVSRHYWDTHRDPLAHPPATEVVARYGTWLAACRAAGIPTPLRTKPEGEIRRWTDDELAACMREFFASGVGDSPGAFQEWTAARPDAPAFGTVITRLGRWTELRARLKP